ncbi:hypothetical protein BCI9360_00961 [Bacillus sp. CECT 9360]|nr:hypothetical protein BCI9360_00961 [Bacillus sp. CECT 9360]
MVTLDQPVPQDHLVRKMEAALDFSFIYDLVKDIYSEVGRPSIDAADNQGDGNQYGLTVFSGLWVP